jgi:hypothetical protein
MNVLPDIRLGATKERHVHSDIQTRYLSGVNHTWRNIRRLLRGGREGGEGTAHSCSRPSGRNPASRPAEVDDLKTQHRNSDSLGRRPLTHDSVRRLTQTRGGGTNGMYFHISCSEEGTAKILSSFCTDVKNSILACRGATEECVDLTESKVQKLSEIT